MPPVPPTAGVPMPLLQVDDLLAVQGVTPEIMAKLRPYLIVLPSAPTPLNVNTVPAELLAALVPGMSLSEANSWVARRKTAAWRDPEMFKSQVQNASTLSDEFSVRSNWFLVQSRIRLDRAALNAESLIERKEGVIGVGGTNVVWTRQN